MKKIALASLSLVCLVALAAGLLLRDGEPRATAPSARAVPAAPKPASPARAQLAPASRAVPAMCVDTRRAPPSQPGSSTPSSPAAARPAPERPLVLEREELPGDTRALGGLLSSPGRGVAAAKRLGELGTPEALAELRDRLVSDLPREV